MDELIFFAPLERFEKSHQHGINGIIDVKIAGCVSDNSEDFDKDRIPQDLLDFSIWEKGFGRIKWEHNGGAKSHIGFPLEHKKRQNRTITETVMEGRIYASPGTPQYETAQNALGDIENIQAFNKSHPESPKKIGFSLEGGIQKDKAGNVIKVIITDVVLTSKPKNPNTFAEIKKSLEAGNATDINDMIGGQAGRLQSLDGTHKIQILQGAKQMTFKNKDEYKKFLLDKGFSEEEAEKKAAEWEASSQAFKEREDKHKEINEQCEKAFGAVDSFVKSLNTDTSIETFQKSFDTAIKPIDDKGNIDPTPFLKSIGESNIALRKSITANDKSIGEALANVVSILKSQNEFQKSISDNLASLVEDNETLKMENEELKKSIDTIQTSVESDPVKLAALKIGGEDQKKKEDSLYKPNEVKEAFQKAINACTGEDEDLTTPLTKSFISAEIRGFNWNTIDTTTQTKLEKYLKDKE